jgi:ABC-type Fe3+-siderophore transport system permease subunit
MNLFNNPNKIAENYGIKIAAGLIGFFLVMKLANWHHHVELRFLNLLILSAGVFFALKKFKSTHNDNLNYFRGLIVGVATSGLGSVLFGLFLFVYMQADVDLMESIKANEPMGRHLNPYISGFIVTLEGFFSGFLVTFVLLNWITTDEVNVSHP